MLLENRAAIVTEAEWGEIGGCTIPERWKEPWED